MSSDLLVQLRAEAMEVATPLLANLHARFEDQTWFGWRRNRPPIVQFGQEIRSHFLGHLGLIGIEELHWPWIWGPGYQVYGSDDRTNGEVLEFARSHGGLGYYVHPVMSGDPFEESNLASGPVELVGSSGRAAAPSMPDGTRGFALTLDASGQHSRPGEVVLRGDRPVSL